MAYRLAAEKVWGCSGKNSAPDQILCHRQDDGSYLPARLNLPAWSRDNHKLDPRRKIYRADLDYLPGRYISETHHNSGSYIPVRSTLQFHNYTLHYRSAD